MKKYVFLVMGLLVASTSASARLEVLDGRTFCRDVASGGMFGQPVRNNSHCISFSRDEVRQQIATDNANTHFGNPPVSFRYIVSHDIETGMFRLINRDNDQITPYLQGSTMEDGTVIFYRAPSGELIKMTERTPSH